MPPPSTELSTKIQVDISDSDRWSNIVSYHTCYPTCLKGIQQPYLHICFAAFDRAGLRTKLHGETELLFLCSCLVLLAVAKNHKKFYSHNIAKSRLDGNSLNELENVVLDLNFVPSIAGVTM